MPAKIIMSLTNHHQTQHQDLLQLHHDKEQSIKDLFNSQVADRQVSKVRSSRRVVMPHVALDKMRPQEDPEAFLELYKSSARALAWPDAQFVACLLLLLTREAQLAAQ